MKKNLAIGVMEIGFLIICVGLVITVFALLNPPTTEASSNYLADWSKTILLGNLTQFVGLLIFIVATISAVSWNMRRIEELIR